MTVLDNSMAKKEKASNDKARAQSLQIHFVATDLQIARSLAGNDQTERDRAIKQLKEYFNKRPKQYPFTEDDLLRIWKGLFYAMWMSDKPLYQEQCAESISNLIEFDDYVTAMLFFKTGLITLQNEWVGLDQHRIDKFLLFVRRFLRQALFVVKKFKFTEKNIKDFSNVVGATILDTKQNVDVGLLMHFVEIFLEELSKVSNGTLNPALVVHFLDPFIKKLAFTQDKRESQWIKKFIFAQLIRQHHLGLEHQEKFKAWKTLGFPGSIDSIQKVVENTENGSENEKIENLEPKLDGNRPLDPRAGRVNVDLPQIKFSPKLIADAIMNYKKHKSTTPHSRQLLSNTADDFYKLAQGIYPFGQKRIRPKNEDDGILDIRRAAKKLISFDQKLLSDNKNKKKNKKRKLENDVPEIVPTKKQKQHTDTNVSEKNNNLNEQKKSKKGKLVNDENAINKTLEKSIKKLPLQNGIKNSTVKETNKRKRQEEFEEVMSFVRNSGTWYVTEDAGEKVPTPDHHNGVASKECNFIMIPSTDADVMDEFTETIITDTKSVIIEEPPKKKSKPTDNQSKRFRFGTLKELIRLQQEQERAQRQRQAYVKKLNAQLKKERRQETLATQKSAIKQQLSISHESCSPKKVRINTSLNTSQNIDDHIVHVMASPQIPFDSGRRPGKPLLKAPVKTSPVNPFYKFKRF